MPNDFNPKAVNPTAQINGRKTTFADNVLILAGGSAFALVATILVSPITSRLFGPEAFGLAALFRSGAVMLAAITCLRYEMAIVMPEKDEDAAALFALCCLSLVGMTLLAAALSMFFGHWALDKLNAISLMPVVWLFPVYIFLIGSQLPLRLWCTRKKQFKIIAVGAMLYSLPNAMAEILTGWAGFQTGEDLVAIRVIGLLLTSAFLVWRLIRGDAALIIRHLNIGAIIKVARSYVKFPLLDIWTVLINNLSVNAPMVLLTAMFSPTVCGLYAKAWYLLSLPSLVIGLSVGQVFHRESAVALARGQNLAGMVEAVLKKMITLGVCPFALLSIISPELFGLFLGVRWTASGVYSQILMPQFFLSLLMGSIMSLFGTLMKQEWNLISSAIGLMLRLAVLITGGLLLQNIHLTLLIFMLASLIMGLWRISFLLRAAKASSGRLLAHFVRCVAYSLPSLAILAALKWGVELEALYLVALTPIFSLPYIVFVWHYDLELRNLFLEYWQKVRSLV